MSNYSILVQARNRALAADPTSEQRALYRFFQHALDCVDDMPERDSVVPVSIARWYINQPRNGEG